MYELLSTIENIENINMLKECGATGIIVGDNFHASRVVYEFKKDEIAAIKIKCKELAVKLFVKMNRMYIDSELSLAKQYLEFLKEIDVDGIFYNDLSIYVLAKELNISDKLLYDPDTIVTNHYDVNYHLSKGIYGVILSKEITKEEMISIAKEVKGKVGVIVHGYLNMSYSKRKLIENYFAFINKKIDVKNNKNLYLIEENRTGEMPILETDQGTSVFTDYVQESFDEIRDLYSAGIDIFIVDGIFLNNEIVCDAVKSYSEILNNKGSDVKENYYKKYNDLPLSTGYMEKATNLVK